MPLTEFLSISRGKMDLRPPFSNDPSCRPDADFLELVWENGQIMTQGQSNKSRKASNSNNVQTLAPKPEEDRNANGLKMAKFSMVDSISDDFSLPVTSCEMELDHDVDMVPWLNYPIEDTLHNEYTSDFLRELSGVTWNDLSTENHHLASREKKSSFPGNRRLSAIDSSSSLKHGITSEIPSTTERYRRDGHGEVPQFSLPIEHNMPTSGSLGVTKNNNGSSQQIISQDSTQNTSSLCGFTSLRLQKLDAGQPSTSSSFKNFPTISRHAALAIANHLTAQTASRSENDDKKHALSSNTPADPMLVNSSSGSYQKEMIRHKQSVLAPANGNSDPLPEKPAEEVLSSNQANCKEVVAKTDALHNPANCTTVTKAGMVRERNNEPVVAASSVCSGNSVGRASNEHTRDLKRKSHESGESESLSEEVEEESVGARKAPARTGSKRTRAAEVHNLSERRRRDRINEKMRALQELIPNCNKVDKASMLDEAIEYLKTLQLQVQMLSMGSGFYMQPMMLPPGMQPFRAAHIPHFSPMGFGMGMGMGFGFNMLDMNSGMKMLPFQAPHYPIPNASPAFHGIPGSSLQAFGHPGQGLPMSMQQSPVLPASAVPALNIPVDPNVLAISGTTNVAPLAPSGSSKDVSQQVVHNNNLGSSTNQASIQSRNEGNGHPPCYNQAHAVNASEAPVPSSGTESMPS